MQFWIYLMKRNNLRIYIHIPFCVKKCNYCSFVSYTEYKEDDYDNYIDYIEKEIRLYKEKKELSPYTIYIGGGTPSLLPSSQLYKLRDIIDNYMDVSSLREFTIEANPESVTPQKAKTWKDIGINRISLGVQSFNDKILHFLGRAHTVSHTKKAISILKRYFANISFDLIYGIPGQDLRIWESTLMECLSYEPYHISIYALSLEKDTPFFESFKDGKFSLVEEDTYINMYKLGIELLSQHGYKRYEISNFAKPGKESLHNIGYWTYEDYIGLGISASSFLEKRRYTNHFSLKKYREDLDKGTLPIMEYDNLSRETMMSEYAILRLRTDDGLKDSDFYSLFGISADRIFGEEFEFFIDLGLIEETIEGWKLTQEGILVSDRIFMEILR